jgi:hypothetical protein
MTQPITDEERQLAENPPVEPDLGEDADAEPADNFDQSAKDVDLVSEQDSFVAVLDDSLEADDLTKPGLDNGEVV